MSTTLTARNATLDAALDEAKREYTARNPKSLAQHQSATDKMPGGNTRTVLFFDPFPVAFARGAGARLWDMDGHEYIDFLGEYTAGIAGHSHPAIRRAVTSAMEDGINFGGHNTMEPRFAAEVKKRFPSMELLRFTNSGTEANLLAISTAIGVTGRRKIMVFRNGYHGAVFMFSPGANLNAPFDYVFGTYNDIAATEALIEENAAELAAVILEPMMGGGGCIPAELPFLEMLRERTAKHGIMLVFDEVMTSRLSPGGLQKLHGIKPDMTTLGKYIGGGMSFGCFGGRADVMARFDPRQKDSFPHAGTFNNNVLTMAAGIAALTEVYTPEAADALNAMGETLRKRLNAVVAKHDAAMQFTGIGSMMAVHMTRAPVRSPADAATGSVPARDLLFFDLLKAGIWLAWRGMMALSLPLTADDGDKLVEAVDEFAASRKQLLQ